MAKEQTERKSIDVTEFAILSFLSDRNHSAKELRELLEKFTRISISRSPMYRRMRQLVNEGYVYEVLSPGNENNTFGLTEEGEKFCLEWADTLQILVGMTPYRPGKEQ